MSSLQHIMLALLLLSAGCSQVSHPLNTPSKAAYPQNYESFEQYMVTMRQFLLENRYFITKDKDTELQANMPMEYLPENGRKATKAVLLIHGLGDSPYSYTDIAKALVKQNYLVRTLLLPGHGTKPGDMLEVSYQDWNATVKKQVELLKQEVDDIYLGGYSTGGNLVYSYAVQDSSIKGLMLFAPAFVAKSKYAFLSPWVAKINPSFLASKPENVTNYTRYYQTPMNGFGEYYKTSQAVIKRLSQEKFTRPVFMVLAEHDSVLNSQAISEYFYNDFTNPKNQLLWFGTKAPSDNPNTTFINSYNEAYRISSMSHLGMMFKADNPYYGINGRERICLDGKDYERCKNDKEIWYGAWDGAMKDKVHARLTFNPWFDTMMEKLQASFE